MRACEIWESPKQHNTGDESSEVPDSIRPSSPRDFSVIVSPLSIPHIDPDDFDWHLEGTHVELCNRDGEFLEGAALCSKTKSHLQLYNEDRGFFEVGCSLQGFKVVIHGLDNLKAFPMGQIIDVYSPLIGRFRTGTVLKAAMHGHLIPIRFGPSKAIEWIDLKSQTFKLVFLPHITEAFEHPEESDRSNLHAPRNSREHPPHRSHGHESHRSHYLEYPRLCEGQGIEIFDDQSKQYLKCKVVAQSNWSNEAYVFELAENPAGGASTKHIVSSLSRLRSRLLLQPAQWGEYRRVLVGHRVDVYDRVGKSVMNGKIHAVDGSSAEPAIQVRFKDGHQSWIDLRTNKVKLRMHSASETARIPDEGPTTPQQVSLRTESFSTNGSANEEVASEQASSPFPAVQAAKPDLAPSNLDPSQPLARVPSGEESSLPNTSPALNPASEAEVPATGSNYGARSFTSVESYQGGNDADTRRVPNQAAKPPPVAAPRLAPDTPGVARRATSPRPAQQQQQLPQQDAIVCAGSRRPRRAPVQLEYRPPRRRWHFIHH
ncbi:hypothetical protein ON010_g18215 [Phytophthora cinnamomi]|nr:hypothetical protein ON010_g18215 [Phytophthora cinnamomi]